MQLLPFLRRSYIVDKHDYYPMPKSRPNDYAQELNCHDIVYSYTRIFVCEAEQHYGILLLARYMFEELFH